MLKLCTLLCPILLVVTNYDHDLHCRGRWTLRLKWKVWPPVDGSVGVWNSAPCCHHYQQFNSQLGNLLYLRVGVSVCPGRSFTDNCMVGINVAARTGHQVWVMHFSYPAFCFKRSDSLRRQTCCESDCVSALLLTYTPSDGVSVCPGRSFSTAWLW